MIRKIFLAWATGLFLAALSPRASQGQQIKISHVVHVSTDNPLRDHGEVILAADPADARRLLACAMVQPVQPSMQAWRNIAYLSLDAGLHWSETLEFGGTLWSSDPSCSFAQNHLAFYAGLDFDSFGSKWIGKTVLYTSSNSGSTWSASPKLPQGDREFITVDSQRNKIYMGEIVNGLSLDGDKKAPLVLYESDDNGRSFQTRAVLSAGKELRVFGYPGGILPDGTFVTAFSAIPESAAILGKSDGATGAARVFLYNTNRLPQVALPVVNELHECNAWRNSTPMPSLAVDDTGGTFRGRIYVAWPDSRTGRCEILFSHSADEGRTWSSPTRVNDDQTQRIADEGPDDFHPVLAVNPQGVVGVLWYDRRDDPDNLSWQPRFSASLDGGLTFLPSVGIGDAGMKIYQAESVNLSTIAEGGGSPPFRSGGAIRVSFGYQSHELTAGETAGLASDRSGFFHALWIDNRTGVEQVWTARISVAGAVEKNGSAALAPLDDVSNDVAILSSGALLNRRSQTFTADVYLQNTSNATIEAPLELRVLRLGSQVGEPEFANADDHKPGAGAVFDLSSLAPREGLRPGQRTGPKRIVVRLHHLPLEISPGDYGALSRMVTIDFSVLGKRAH
jgi:hypothetical protein